jgi:hypothetical protein
VNEVGNEREVLKFGNKLKVRVKCYLTQYTYIYCLRKYRVGDLIHVCCGEWYSKFSIILILGHLDDVFVLGGLGPVDT